MKTVSSSLLSLRHYLNSVCICIPTSFLMHGYDFIIIPLKNPLVSAKTIQFINRLIIYWYSIFFRWMFLEFKINFQFLFFKFNCLIFLTKNCFFTWVLLPNIIFTISKVRPWAFFLSKSIVKSVSTNLECCCFPLR
jgi:hypothetical protein